MLNCETPPAHMINRSTALRTIVSIDPRILSQAVKLAHRQGLSILYRPEVRSTTVPKRATASERYGLILSVCPCSSNYALEISLKYLHNISTTSFINVTHLTTYHTVQLARPRKTASYLEAPLRSRLRPLFLARLIKVSGCFENLPQLYNLHNDHTMSGGLEVIAVTPSDVRSRNK